MSSPGPNVQGYDRLHTGFPENLFSRQFVTRDSLIYVGELA